MLYTVYMTKQSSPSPKTGDATLKLTKLQSSVLEGVALTPLPAPPLDTFYNNQSKLQKFTSFLCAILDCYPTPSSCDKRHPYTEETRPFPSTATMYGKETKPASFHSKWPVEKLSPGNKGLPFTSANKQFSTNRTYTADMYQ